MNQLAFFEEKTLDIRTEKQVNNLVSYDVGEKIGGARKDLAESRKDFLMKPSLELLESLEKQDVQTAAELVVKSTFFSWFSLEDCKERGVEPNAAKALQLLISRIPKTSKDTPKERSQYMNALIFLSDLLQTVYKFSEFRQAVSRIANMITLENYSDKNLLQSIERDKESIRYEDDSSIYKAQLIRRVEEWKGYIFLVDLAHECNISKLGGTFITFFKKQSSRKSLLSNADQYSTWEELLPTVSKDAPEGKGKIQRQPVWVRALPKEPTRLGGKSIQIETPDAFIQHFGFRSSEFGHYMEDQRAIEHLSRSAEAYTDLSSLLNIPTDAVSLGGGLAMAFGSRGRGKALGHYEPSRKVINLTKEKGSLGILAHEWWHALDHYLYSMSYDFQNGKVGFLTNGEYGQRNGYMNRQVQDALSHLLNTIINGQSTGSIDVSDVKNTYRYRDIFKEDYRDVEGDLKAFMDSAIQEFDGKVERHLKTYEGTVYFESLQQKYTKKRVKFIREKAEALAQYHETVTGERVERIPYTTNRTAFYENSISLDKRKIGKYWSSAIEMTARSFESYVYDLLLQRNWTSDYLVCGVRDSVFPHGEERQLIHAAMGEFIEAIRPMLQRATRDQLKK